MLHGDGEDIPAVAAQEPCQSSQSLTPGDARRNFMVPMPWLESFEAFDADLANRYPQTH